MILLEEWIANVRGQFLLYKDGELESGQLFPNLRRLTGMLDPSEIQGYDGCEEKLERFMAHYQGFERLDPERQAKRAQNGLEMLEKLSGWYLFPPDPQGDRPRVDCAKLEQPLKYIKGVGPRKEKLLEALEIRSIEDLIQNYPRAYDDRRKLLNIRQLRPAERATLVVQAVDVQLRTVGRGREVFEVIGSDGFSQIVLSWFNQGYLRQWIKTGDYLCVTGIPKRHAGSWEMASPDFEKLEDKEDARRMIYPIYRLTAGLFQKQMRTFVHTAIQYLPCVSDPVPASLIEKRGLMALSRAFEAIHFPVSFAHLQQGKRRLIYDEFFTFQLCMQWIRKKRERKLQGVAKVFSGRFHDELVKRLDFELTGGQKEALAQIEKGLADGRVMNQLLQGDVGSGKTVVALIAMADTVEAGFQAVMMAPTAILAQQHYANIQKAFDPLGISSALLISKMPAREKKAVKQGLEDGSISVVVGTHALIQEDVAFRSLGLVVVDEQHRFGVRQREGLMSKGSQVDTLVMTATPIPRTLAMSIYGDLEVVTIPELPKRRLPVKTVMVNESRASEVWRFATQEAEKGNQVFIVYPVIEESEQMELKAATTMYERLSREIFPQFELGLLHGRMAQEEKDAVMQAFAEGGYPILVSTTVIEVGIDVPGATVMVIEHPERFGLSQLHQLRGRVGRSDRKSYCFLISAGASEEVYERLKYFTDTHDGFALSEYDLRTRGPGEFLGLRQHGIPDFRLGNMIEDGKVLSDAMSDASELLEQDPDLEGFPGLMALLEKKYAERMRWVDVG